MIKILSDQKALQKGKKRIAVFGAKLFSFLLLLCFAYVVLYPFLFKILASFMSYDDIFDESVALIPKHWVFDTYKKVFDTDGFLSGMLYTAGISFMVAVLTTAAASFSGYGLARFRFPGHKAMVAYVIFTMMLPFEIISISMYSTFRYFDILGIFKLITGSGIQLTGNPLSLAILAITALSFRGGIFVYLLRQYYKDIPNELTEAACVDGAGVFKTYFSIALPMSRSMLIVVFALSFAWQWTDTFYSGMLISDVNYLTKVVAVLNGIKLGADRYYNEIIANTAAMVAVLPLIILYLFLQKHIIQGIERSGIVG